jgi:hypothetical protein
MTRLYEYESAAWFDGPGFLIDLSLSESTICSSYVILQDPTNLILKRIAICAGFGFGAFVVEYRALGPYTFITKIYAADFPFSIVPSPRNVTVRPIVL